MPMSVPSIVPSRPGSVLPPDSSKARSAVDTGFFAPAFHAPVSFFNLPEPCGQPLLSPDHNWGQKAVEKSAMDNPAGYAQHAPGYPHGLCAGRTQGYAFGNRLYYLGFSCLSTEKWLTIYNISIYLFKSLFFLFLLTGRIPGPGWAGQKMLSSCCNFSALRL